MANFVYIATSLDGMIASEGGGLEWLDEIPNPDGSDYGFAEFIDRVDGILMGRNTFGKVLTFGDWPYTKPVFILSQTLTSVPDALDGKAEIVSGELKGVISSLHSRGVKNLYVDGGKVIQSCLAEDLIDELIITRVPLLLGKGIPLFSELSSPMQFSHQSTNVLNNYLVKSRYLRESIAKPKLDPD